MKECDILGEAKHTLTPHNIFKGVKTSNPQDLLAKSVVGWRKLFSFVSNFGTTISRPFHHCAGMHSAHPYNAEHKAASCKDKYRHLASAKLKLWVLRSLRKLMMSGSARMSSDSLLHADGPVTSVRKGALAELGAKLKSGRLVARSRSSHKATRISVTLCYPSAWHQLSLQHH